MIKNINDFCLLFSKQMFTKQTTLKILNFFTSKIDDSFSLRSVGRNINMNPSLVHRSIQPLFKEKILKRDKHKNISLNYKSDVEVLSYSEYLRREDFLTKKENVEIKLFRNEILGKIDLESFVLILFGSAVETNDFRDIDILLIVKDNVEFYDKFLENISSNYSLPFECRVINYESVYEMLSKRNERNIINELLNKHIILSGGELFYSLLKRGRR
ncbi:MAG: hypothetical protein ACOCP4_00235 [Candidatus Woesearchaeota archaeon]